MTYSTVPVGPRDRELMADRPALIRVHSHRARRNLIAALGRERVGEGWFSYHRPGEFYRLRTADVETALSITGVSRARDTGNLQRCITL